MHVDPRFRGRKFAKLLACLHEAQCLPLAGAVEPGLTAPIARTWPRDLGVLPSCSQALSLVRDSLQALRDQEMRLHSC